MSLDHLPPSIEQGVQDCAMAWHPSHDEAIIRILETGLATLQTQISPPRASETLDLRSARDFAKQAKLEALAQTPLEGADAVFGAFAGVPEFQESIDSVIARRAPRYGFEA